MNQSFIQDLRGAFLLYLNRRVRINKNREEKIVQKEKNREEQLLKNKHSPRKLLNLSNLSK